MAHVDPGGPIEFEAFRGGHGGIPTRLPVGHDAQDSQDGSMVPPPSAFNGNGHVEYHETVECPSNFGMVATGIYRSSFPRQEHFSFLKQLGLKSILVLLAEPYPEENAQFVAENNIKLFRVGLSGNKEPFVNVDPKDIAHALRIIVDPANQPLLIHCNQGRHRTGCVVGCLRRAQNWSLSMVFDEYRKYAFPKARPLDQLLIEMFEPDDDLSTTELWD